MLNNEKDKEMQAEDRKTVMHKLELLISRKLKLQADPHDPVVQRKVILKSLHNRRGQQAKMAAKRAEEDEVEKNDKKLNDLEVIESQYTDYCRNIIFRDKGKAVEDRDRTLEKEMARSKLSKEAKHLLKLKATTPFRINLDEFENKGMNIQKYYDMIGLKEMAGDHTTEPTLSTDPQERTEAEGITNSNDDFAKFGRFLTQPSMPELTDRPKAEIKIDREITGEPNFRVKGKLGEKVKALNKMQVPHDMSKTTKWPKDPSDHQSTKYSSQTIHRTTFNESQPLLNRTSNGQFLIKRRYRSRIHEEYDVFSSLKTKYSQLASLMNDQSSESQKFGLKCKPDECSHLMRLTSKASFKPSKSFITKTEPSFSSPRQKEASLFSRIRATEQLNCSKSKLDDQKTGQLADKSQRPPPGHHAWL
jgi:hypothetical protein